MLKLGRMKGRITDQGVRIGVAGQAGTREFPASRDVSRRKDCRGTIVG